MRKYFFVLLLISNLVFAGNTDTTHILVVHPTINNIKTFTYFVDNDIINIDKVKFTGIYYTKEKYDYSNSTNFLADTNLPYFSLFEITEDISKEKLFQKNKLTPVFDSLFSISDGIIFLGGPDIQPSIYSEKTELLTEITDPYRHYFELSFLYHLLGNNSKSSKPLLNKNPNYVVWAICLGMQTMNIATGGTLYQDIPSNIYNKKYVEDILNDKTYMHKNYFKNLYPRDSLTGGVFHPVIKTDLKNKIYTTLKTNANPYVYSWHHQAVNVPGHGLQILFTSPDVKVVEGVCHEQYKNVYGFQFHPEYLKLYDEKYKLKINNSDKTTDLKTELINNNSYNFHLSLWKYFSILFL